MIQYKFQNVMHVFTCVSRNTQMFKDVYGDGAAENEVIY